MRSLLDVNVLLAMLDSDHHDHRRTREWFEAEADSGWASCAITQNGFVRIICQSGYVNPVTPAHAIRLLDQACRTEYHEFWPSSISLLDPEIVDQRRIHGPQQVTDVYLLALATARGGRFVTFDRRIPVSAARNAETGNLVVL